MHELGPDLFERLNATQWVGNQTPVTYGVDGLSAADIAAIEAQLGFALPEDFAFLLRNMRDPGGVFFPWSSFQKQQYDQSIAWVLRGIEFDIEKNELWLKRWGERPGTPAEALDIARRDFATWPKLLPVYGHRFLPADPCRIGNPVFSIVQTDIVYYGTDLADYLINEFCRGETAGCAETGTIRKIDVWSEFVGYRPQGNRI